jgi:NOL1/NOP2/fmu family ribosome biogenesis protein
MAGKDRYRIFSGNISKNELIKLAELVKIDNIGLHLGTEVDGKIRLGIDACHLLKDKINKNIIEISDERTFDWFNGREISNDGIKERGFVIVKNGDDLLGSGKIGEERILNFLPKERRIQKR